MDSLISIEATDRPIRAGNKSVGGAMEDRPLVVVVDRTASESPDDAIAEQNTQIAGIGNRMPGDAANRSPYHRPRKGYARMRTVRLTLRSSGNRNNGSERNENEKDQPSQQSWVNRR